MKHEETLFPKGSVKKPIMSHPIAQPLRPFTEPEREALQRVSRAPSEPMNRHQRAVALLAVADGLYADWSRPSSGMESP
jgi:hypothetical protein